MAYLSFLSLEQDFALKLKSDAIHKTNDPIELQNQLIDLFTQTLTLDQEMQGILFQNKINQLRLLQEFDDQVAAYKAFIKTKFDLEKLKEALIEAHKKYAAQKNFAEIVRQETLTR